MIGYFDTSAAFKLLLVEEGSATAWDVWEGVDGRVCSVALYPEARAALAAAQRSGRLSVSGHANAKRVLYRLMRKVGMVSLGEPLAQIAGDVAERFQLRGYDAVHLASALTVADPDLVLVTWDTNLATAGRLAGLSTVP